MEGDLRRLAGLLELVPEFRAPIDLDRSNRKRTARLVPAEKVRGGGSPSHGPGPPFRARPRRVPDHETDHTAIAGNSRIGRMSAVRG